MCVQLKLSKFSISPFAVVYVKKMFVNTENTNKFRELRFIRCGNIIAKRRKNYSAHTDHFSFFLIPQFFQ